MLFLRYLQDNILCTSQEMKLQRKGVILKIKVK